MEEFRIKLAALSIGVCARFPETRTFCRDYLTQEEPAFSVVISPEDMAFEQEKSARTRAAEGRPAGSAPETLLETLALYRQIAERLPGYDTLLLHGSVVALDGVAYLFTAKSGTGKSTHTRFWRERFGSRAVMINDDKPLIRVTEAGAEAFGTPWDGKHHLSCNSSAPLKALCILERAAENRIEPVSAAEAYPMLLQQSYRPADAGALLQTLTLLDLLSKKTALYQLGCNLDPEAAEIAWRGMNRKG